MIEVKIKQEDAQNGVITRKLKFENYENFLETV